MKKSTYTKIWTITLLTLVLLVTSVSLVAYWPIAVQPPEGGTKDTTINLGSGGEVITFISLNDLTLDSNLELVPKGKDNTERKTEEITGTITLKWDEDAEISEGSAAGATNYIGDLTINYEVIADNVTPEQQETINDLDLIIIEFDCLEIINFAEETTFNLSITMKEPNDKNDYILIRGRELKIKLIIKIDNPRENK